MKRVYLFLFTIGLLALFVGCNSPVSNNNSSSSNSSDPIIGTWNPTGAYATGLSASGVTIFTIIAKDDKSASLTFANTSGSGTLPGSWSLSGGIYSITLGSNHYTATISNGVLTLNSSMTFNKN